MGDSSVRKDLQKAIDYNWKSSGGIESPDHQRMMRGDYKPDAFDDALGYIAPAAGAVIGGGLLGRATSRGRKASLQQMQQEMSPAEWRKFKDAYDKSAHSKFAVGLNVVTGGLAGAGAGNMVAGITSRERHRPKK